MRIINNLLEYIGDCTFFNSDLKSITFRGTDIILGECCIPGGFISKLKEIHIPKGSTDIFSTKLPEPFWRLFREDCYENSLF